MSLQQLSVLVALPAALGGSYDSNGQCAVEQFKQYTNCWGHDLTKYDGPGSSWEDCCSRCADIPDCTVFTFDKWNATGQLEDYCFFKSQCDSPRDSDTAVSGIIKATSTSSTTTTTTSSTAPTTTTTTSPTTAPETTTTAPETTVGPTTTPDAKQPQCKSPEPLDAPGFGTVEPIKVQVKEDCCHMCVAPNCTYVTFGQYKNSSSWACFRHQSKSDTNSPASLLQTFARRLSGSAIAAASCADLGLTNCQGAEVVMPPQAPGVSPLWLAVSGIVAFLFAFILGFGFSRKMKLSNKFVK